MVRSTWGANPGWVCTSKTIITAWGAVLIVSCKVHHCLALSAFASKLLAWVAIGSTICTFCRRSAWPVLRRRGWTSYLYTCISWCNHHAVWVTHASSIINYKGRSTGNTGTCVILTIVTIRTAISASTCCRVHILRCSCGTLSWRSNTICAVPHFGSDVTLAWSIV